MNTNKESVLEGARVIVLAVVSYLLTEGVIGLIVEYVVGVRLDTQMKVVITGLITAALRALDKKLHLESLPGTGFLKERGLTGF